MTLLDSFRGSISVSRMARNHEGHSIAQTPTVGDPLPSPDRRANQDSSLSLAAFVGDNFIPEHVAQKSFAGRKHYQAMLKHILRPETVDSLFSQSSDSRRRMKAIPGWPYLDDVEVSQLAEKHVYDLTAAAVAQGYSPQTVKHIRNVVGAIISHAKRRMLFTGDNPAFAVELPPVSPKRGHRLTISEAKSILKLMHYPEKEMALLTMITGMSIQEICGTQWRQVNLTAAPVEYDDRTIPPGHIFVTQHWIPEGVVSLAANRARFVEVSNPLARVLQNLKHETGFSRAENFVLGTSSGAPICPTSLRILRLKPIGRQLGMPWLTWQVLKGAHETLLSELRLQLNTDLVLSANVLPAQEVRNSFPSRRDNRA